MPSTRYLAKAKSVAAFTLIELLVVIGIIGIMAGAVGVAMRSGGDASTALQASQSTISSMLSAARGQAALTGRNAALMVFATDTDATTYMRKCVIAVRNEADNAWIQAGEFVYLPNGIYILPPTSPTGGYVETGVDFGGIRSNALTNIATITNQTGNWYSFQYTPLGTVVPATGGMIAVSVASPQPPTTTPQIKFTNSNNIRGVSISKYGIPVQLNERNSFN